MSERFEENDPRTYTARITVRSYEVDGFEHVNNAIFVNYLEGARGQFLLDIGLGYAQFRKWNAFPVVTKVSLEYLASARVDEELLFIMRYSPIKRTQFRMEYTVRNAASGAVIAVGETHHAFVDYEGRSVRVPEEFRLACEQIR
ncbi:MAG: thioesterase family protein [Candidatus Poribacteria bacterium]|nr:thioesterase family protein [Candidatus Poribacteria bacterium]